MSKDLKPGQLFTFGKHVYQVRKTDRFSPCGKCELHRGYFLKCIDIHNEKGSLNELCINHINGNCYLKQIK